MSAWNDHGGEALPKRMLDLADDSDSARVETGPAQQVTALFEQFRGPVFRYLMRLCGDPRQAEEMTQETFLRLYIHLRDGGSAENIKSWLFTVAHNLAMDASRTAQNITNLDETAWDRLAESHAAARADPEQQ